MRLTATMETGNAWFEDMNTQELAQWLIQAIAKQAGNVGGIGECEGNLRDGNGNKVGTWSVEA